MPRSNSLYRLLRNLLSENMTTINGKNTKNARKTCPQSLWKFASRKLDQIDSVQFLEELRIPPGNNLEALSEDRIGENSIRINDQYRICFKWATNGPYQFEIADYH